MRLKKVITQMGELPPQTRRIVHDVMRVLNSEGTFYVEQVARKSGHYWKPVRKALNLLADWDCVQFHTPTTTKRFRVREHKTWLALTGTGAQLRSTLLQSDSAEYYAPGPDGRVRRVSRLDD